jgi:hypothetical protein
VLHSKPNRVLRAEVRALLADSENATARQLWLALTSEERARAIVAAVRQGPDVESKRVLIKRAVRALKWRPQTLGERIESLVPQLERSGALEGLESYLLLELWSSSGIWGLFSHLYEPPNGGSGTPASNPEAPPRSFEQIESAILQGIGIESVELILIFLLDFAHHSPQWQPILHPWFRVLNDEVLTDLSNRAQTYDFTGGIVDSGDVASFAMDEQSKMVAHWADELDPSEQLTALEQEATDLRTEFEDLAALMTVVSTEMRELGTPPPTSLARRIDAVVAAFEKLRAAVVAERFRLGEEGGSPLDLPSLVRISAALEERRAELERERQQEDSLDQARSILRLACRLTAPHPSLASVLLTCRQAAAALLDEVETLSEIAGTTLEELATGKHPFALLIARVSEGELSVEDDMILDVWLREEFGAALAIAVLSNRVEIGPEQQFEETGAFLTHDAPDAEDSSISVAADEVSPASPAVPTTLAATGTVEPAKNSAPEDMKQGAVAEPHVPKFPLASAPEEVSSPTSRPSPPSQATDEHTQVEPNVYSDARSSADPSASELWKLLRMGQTALAYHLSRVLTNSPVPPPVLRALVLGRELRTGLGEIAQALREPFEWLGNEYLLEESDQRSVHLLIAAGALRPALIAPVTGGAAVLRQLHLEGDLYGLVQAVAAYGERLNGLDPAALGGALSIAQWQEAQKKLRGEVEQYLEQAGRRTILYARATDVWAYWTREDGLVHQLLNPILADDTEALESVITRIHAIDIEREVNKTDKMLRVGKREPIQARALEQFRKYFREVAQFVWQWRDLQALRPKSDHYQQTVIQELRHEFQSRYPGIEKELRELTQKGRGDFAAGGVLLQKAVSDLKALVINGTGLGAGEPSPIHLLNSVLLRTDLLLGRGLEPAETPERIEDALHALLQAEPSWRAAFQNRIHRRDFDGARRLVEYLRNIRDELAPELQEQWNRELAIGLDSLEHDLIETRRRLEEHVSKGLVREGDRSSYDAVIVDVSRQIGQLRRIDLRAETAPAPESYRLNTHHERLGEIRRALNELRHERTNGILSRLQQSGLSAETVERIQAVLDRGDLLTAEEYIDLAESHQLPSASTEERDEFREFFPAAARDLERYLEEYAPPLVVEHLRERLGIPGLKVERLDLDQARQAADLMTVWYEMKRQRGFDANQVLRLMGALGFRPIEVTASNSGHAPEVQVRAQPIADRTEIPAEFFGSRANGHYRLVGIWDRRSEEEISGIVGESHGEAPTFVCFFGRLTEQQRNALGHLSRRQRRTFVVLDEILLLFLCGEPRSRLPVLFRCALPFTHLDPYITTGSLVPPEMFFGRERERDQIIDPYGPSVLYGGRQLGKTALLRHVKRMYHNPSKGWIVRWIDLRAEGIGYYRGTEEIWPVLVNELVRYGILASRTPVTTSPERVIERTQEWLTAEHGRRIVLLLDEADRFLERDAKDDFRQTALLKKLMDQTSRSFKVVFAGLHNVLRTFNDPNHPIGHFGSPIQIGPLIDNGEVRSARALISEPFSLIGYRFESADLVSRILAETNYYPSLLQLYGANLLKHVSERQAARGRPFNPPVVITHEHVEDASRGQDLREAIHQRFALTLQLDPRYEVIAYALAYAIAEHSLSLDLGASAEWIRHDALYWWPEGFEGTSGPELRVLLDEMAGLGVLRSMGGNYTFRNANVLLLMGTEEEIRTALLRDRPAPPVYEAATFREIIRTPAIRMSPLTAQQLGVLRQPSNGVNILIGSEVNDLSFVPEFLTRRFGPEFVQMAEGLSSPRDFVQWLSQLRQEQARHGTTLVVVGHELPWTRSWIDGAEEWLAKRRSRELGLRVVFIADPQATLRLPDISANGNWTSDVRMLELTQWHDGALNQWLDANNVASSPAVRQRISEVTGNRPYILYRYIEKFNRTFTWEQPLNELEHELGHGPLRDDVMEALGLEDTSSVHARILRILAALDEPADVEDLTTLMDGALTSSDLDSALQWAEHLQLVKRSGADNWVLDSFVRQFL